MSQLPWTGMCPDFASGLILILSWFHFPSLPPVFDQLDVISYEEVVRLPAFKRKTLVLIGMALLPMYMLCFSGHCPSPP